MKLAIRACALSLVVAFVAQSAWAGGSTVHVRGYTRKDGTYVAPYTRSAPGSKSYSATSAPNTSSAATSSDLGTTHVSGYYRKGGTYVNGFDRAAPGTSSASTTATVAVPAATPDLRSSTQTVQDAIAAGRIVVKNPKPVVKDTKPVVTSTTTTVPASGVVVRDSHGRIKRSEPAKHEFMRMTGYPDGRPGYIVDHIVPLKRGGCDCPSNMQWQTIQEAKAKDKWE